MQPLGNACHRQQSRKDQQPQNGLNAGVTDRAGKGCRGVCHIVRKAQHGQCQDGGPDHIAGDPAVQSTHKNAEDCHAHRCHGAKRRQEPNQGHKQNRYNTMQIILFCFHKCFLIFFSNYIFRRFCRYTDYNHTVILCKADIFFHKAFKCQLQVDTHHLLCYDISK